MKKHTNPLVSIIIPVKQINNYLLESMPHLLKQVYPRYEIIILPDAPGEFDVEIRKARILYTGPRGPAEKRDLGAQEANGEILAFIDDDAYPAPNWLSKAVTIFLKHPDVGAVGGPNVTPPDATFFEKVSGEVLASPFISGPTRIRYRRSRAQEVDDLPSVNLLVRTSLFKELKGFDSSYWPGEDTKLCDDIARKGEKIVYHPDVLVYHHRRTSLKEHIRQIFSYAKHRGYFMKRLPGNSLKFSYFMPSLFLIGLMGGLILSPFNNIIALLYLAVVVLYFTLLFSSILLAGKFKLVFPFVAVAFLTQVAYGAGLLIGLFKKDLKSKLRI